MIPDLTSMGKRSQPTFPSALDGTLAERLYTAEQASIAAAAATASPAAASGGGGSPNARLGATTATSEELLRLRTDLAAAQSEMTTLTSEVKALEVLKPQLDTVVQRLDVSERKRMQLERRCKDLADEARTKDRRYQHVQDEMLAQEMELNMVLQREQELKQDNQMLVDRWMALKGNEAEAMNEMNSAAAIDLRK